MRKAFKYRVYPNKKTLHILQASLEECRWLYNDTLDFRKKAWEDQNRTATYYETKRRIPLLKVSRPSLATVHSQVLQNVTERVELSFQAYFRRVKAGQEPGYPRYDSLTYTQSGFKLGEIKTLTLRRSSTGKWYACFSVEVAPKRLPPKDNSVGIDVGITTFATFSDGVEIENPRFFRKEEKELAKVQRKLSKGTPERRFRRKAVARTHERIANKRNNFSHQESRKIVNGYGIICVEDLRVNRMLHNHCLAKSISDAAWSAFFSTIQAKAEEAGRVFIAVNPAYNSQDCSGCGHRQKMALSERVFNCPCCNLHISRDLNAALNIKAVGLHSVGSALDAPVFRRGE
jgi:putative transposase